MSENASIFTTREGHLSLAEKGKSVLDNLDFTTHQNEHGGSEFNLYTPFYQLFPTLWKIPYALHQNKKAINLLATYAKITYQDKVIKQLKEQQPSVVISTWFMLNNILAQANNQNSFKLINILSDPRTFATIGVHKEAYNLVFDEKAQKQAIKLGIPKDKAIISGWFVRDRFEAPYNQIQVKRSLGLNPDRLTLLIVAGSEGTATVLKILPAFIGCPQAVDVIVACGSSKRLASTVRALSKIVSATTPQSQVSIYALGFTKEIHRYIQAADLVMGKAGPNLLFEAIACKTPFFAITHIAGQEDGNLDIIKEYKVGWVEEEPIRAIKLLKQILKNPKSLYKFESNIEKLAAHNKRAKTVLKNLILSKK
jgi:UDP-N-acetylglucosamine:LPS N-acetylglucosamine transferase